MEKTIHYNIIFKPEPEGGFTVKDFQDECDPMVYEIKKTGIKIA